jgi:C-terminal processing protease CtpA/Prc
MIRILRFQGQKRRPFNIALVVTLLQLIAYRGISAQDTAGIGVALSRVGDHVVIGKLLPDGSAARSGKLSVDDWIIAVSDETIPDTDVSSSSINEVVALMRGKAGTTIRITVVSKGKSLENAFTVP